MESNQFTLHVIFNNKSHDLSLDKNKTLNDVKKIIESQINDVSNRQYNLLTKNGQSISGDLSTPFIKCSSSFLDDLNSNGSIQIHLSLLSELNSTAMMNSIDSILSMPSSSTSKQQEKDDILDGFDNLLDLSEFDGMLKSTESKNNISSNNSTQITQKTTNPIDLLGELEKLEDQNKKGLVDKQGGISDQDFDRILGLNDIDEKQKELERQRKLYEEQQNLAQQQLLLQQQQYAMQTSANLVIPVENQNNRLAMKYQGYDPNVTFVLDDDDDDDWVPRQEDLIKKEKQREKERKEREKREKKMKKKNKKGKKGGKEEVNVQVDDKLEPVSPRGEETKSPRVEEPKSPRDEEPKSPRDEEPKSPRDEELISPRVQEPSQVESSPSHVENQTNDDPLPPPEDDDIISPPEDDDEMPPPKEDIVPPSEDNVEMPPPKEDIILPTEELDVSPPKEELSVEVPSSPKEVPKVSSPIHDDLSKPGDRKSQWITRKPDTNLERKDFLLSRGSVIMMDFKNYFQEENNLPSSSLESGSKNNYPPPKDDDPLPPPMDDDPLPPPNDDDDPLPPPKDDDPLPPPSENEKPTTQYILPDIKPFNIVYEPLTVPPNDTKPSSDNSKPSPNDSVKNEQDDLFQALDNLLFETDSKMEEQIESVQKIESTPEDTLKFLDEAISFLDS